jgi:hypothetical protein
MAAPEITVPILRQPGKTVEAEKSAAVRFIFGGEVEDAVPLMLGRCRKFVNQMN